MPRFIISLVLIIFLSLAVAVRTVIFTSPEDIFNRVVFFASLLIFTTFFPPTLFFLLRRRNNNEPVKRRAFLRDALRHSFVFALFFVTVPILKVIGALSIINLVLLIVLLILYWIYFF